MDAPPHVDESARLAALARLGILDTPPEERFDRIARLAAHVLDTPIASISLVDEERQWLKSSVGTELPAIPRDLSFCAHLVDGDEDQLVVPDTTADVRFRHNPLVASGPRIGFYASHVVRDPGGHPVGTLCVADQRPRHPGPGDLRALADLAAMVEAELARTDELELLLRLEVDERTTSVLLDALDEGLVLFDADGRVVQWNHRAEEILGVSPGDLLDRAADDPRWDVVHADETPTDPADHPVAVALRTGVESLDQTIGITRDGQRRWLRVQCRPVLDRDRNVTAVVVAFTDITGELEVRATSAQLTERLRVAIDHAPVGTALADRLGRFTYVNEACSRMLGRARDELVGRPALEQVHPDDAAVGAGAIAQLRDGRRTTLTLELRLVDTSGRSRYVRAGATRLEQSTSEAAYLIQVEDVTLARELSLALRRNEALARTSLESLDQGVMLVAADQEIRLINPAAVEILGADRERVAARLRPAPATPRPDEPILFGGHVVDQVLGTGEAVRHRVLRWERDDGRRVLLRLSALPAELDDGSLGAVVAFTDITEQRALELELERYGILFEHANDIITVIDADGQVRYASPSNGRVLGYEHGWRHPRGVLGLVHPDDLPAAQVELAALMEGGLAPRDPFTVRVRDAAGGWRHLECVGVNLLDEPAVRGVVLTSRDVTERQRLLDQLAHRASHDLLTGLPNRSVLTDQLASAVARSERSGGRVALCYLDLDGFKAVNDTLGHAAGDAMLVDVAERIRTAVRSGDTPARIGGDEFVVVLDPVAGESHAVRAASRLRDAVLDAESLRSCPVRCGVSVGVAVSRPGDGPEELAARADAALYVSKSRRACSVELATD